MASILLLSGVAFAQQLVYPAQGQKPELQKQEESECYAGAEGGAVGGNDVGNAAAKGAVVGGVARRNKNLAAASQANQQTADAQEAGEAAYANGRHACLEGRGYSVK